MRADDTVRFLVFKQLDETIGAFHRLRTAIGGEGEFTDRIFGTFFLKLFFGFANRSNFRPGVNNTRDLAVIDMAFFAGNHFCKGNAVFFRLVGKHRTGNGVANRKDAANIGLEIFVGFDTTAFVEFNTNFIQAKAGGVRTATDGNQHHVSFEFLCIAAFGRFNSQGHAGLGGFCCGYLVAEFEFKTLLGKDALGLFDQLAIHARQNAVQEFNNGDFGTQTTPDGTKFQTDDASTNHNHLLRHFRKSQRTGRRDDFFFVNFNTRQRGDFRTRRDDDVLGIQGFFATIKKGNLDRGRRGDLAGTFDIGNLVLLEQELDAFDVAVNDLVLAGHHLFKIDLRLGHFDAVGIEMFRSFFEQVG